MSNKNPTSTPRYGRGKFTASKQYIDYMSRIVKNPTYANIPNAVSENGRINWQVSSGKTTSFYKFYEARFKWWATKADENAIKGTGNSDDRFSIAARVMHPTGYRPCRLCGKEYNVGYFYANSLLAKQVSKILGEEGLVEKAAPISFVLDALSQEFDQDQLVVWLTNHFPERAPYFDKYGYKIAAFEKSNFIRSKWLSPGFMCNPPDRLDGFHDYCILCRPKSDPGRSRENLASYTHDRRVFELWSEGDWLVADKLYSLAGKGICAHCGKQVEKISPDHIGPLACGFKQLALFTPMCRSCNSSKNRRMTLGDIKALIVYEQSHSDSAASWQVRSLWDANKHGVQNDRDAKELSDLMRSLQDVYIRTLQRVYSAGNGGVLTTFLHPEYAGYKVAFAGLNRATLTFKSFNKTAFKSRLRTSLAGRVARIAFEELDRYAKKDFGDRKLRKDFQRGFGENIESILALAAHHASEPRIVGWRNALQEKDAEIRQAKLIALLAEDAGKHIAYPDFDRLMRASFDKIGNTARINSL